LWLALKWFETRHEFSSIKYIIIIMYLFGLSYGVHLLSLLVTPTILILLFCYQPKLLLRWKFWAISIVLFAIGVSTYFMIYIRAGMAPAINENDPSTWANFIYYLNRQQYGSKSLFATVFDRVAPIWDYQIKYMYLRYFAWNFIGKGTTIADIGRGFIAESLSFNGLKGLPFLLGLTGFLYHFKKDWKKALAVLAFFIISGVGLIIYLNQPNPQPRERDYVYVGSFFAFSLWIGLGVYGILKFLKRWLEDGVLQKTGIALAAGVLFFIGPVNEFRCNYDTHDRSGNYVPWDYAYNILIGCEPNAILFTNGDNDTFPVWYMQEVEGIRKDVKIVNLSLLNTNWYIYQLRHYDPEIDFKLSDVQIMNIRPMQFNAQDMNLTVPKGIYDKHFAEYNESTPEAVLKDPHMKFTVTPSLSTGGFTGITVQDQMVLRIVVTNLGIRPIYFAVTVDPKNFVGLREYLRWDGINYRLTPVKNPKIHEERLEKCIRELYRYRGINNPDVYLDFGTKRLLRNYYNAYMMLAHSYSQTGKRYQIPSILDELFEKVPEYRENYKDYNLTEQFGRLYWHGGNKEEFKKRLQDMLSWTPPIPVNKQVEFANYLTAMFQDYETAEGVFLRLYNESRKNGQYLSYLVGIYESKHELEKAIGLLTEWVERTPQDSGAQQKLTILKDSVQSRNNRD